MDTKRVDELRLEAGLSYLTALRSLGFEPDGLAWAWDKKDERFVLLLVTSFYDVAGPLSLSKTLFRAYNLAATPKEIDPFIVRMHSPKHAFIRNLIQGIYDLRIKVRDWDDEKGQFGEPYEAREKAIMSSVNDVYDVVLNDVYLMRDTRRKVDELSRKWSFINKKIDALAA